MQPADVGGTPIASHPERAPLRVGVIGCGLVAQVMHLPYLRELNDRFSLDAICDLSPAVLAAVGDRFGVPTRTVRWQELLATPLDAVVVATPGSHAQPVIAAARAGLHVFVEKPMCFSPAEGQAMIEAARAAGVVLMVGNMKRYDPASGRLAAELAATTGLRLAQVTTLEAPFRPYVAQYPVALPADDVDVDLLAAARNASDAALRTPSPTRGAETRAVYQAVLLDTLIHELNLLRGFLGAPTVVRHARVTTDAATIELEFGDVPVVLTWVDLPGIARYQQELVFYAPDRRLRLSFPSPFLRNAATELVIEGGTVGEPSLVGHPRGDGVRGGVQARAHRVRGQHRRAARATDDRRGRACRRRAVHRDHRVDGSGSPVHLVPQRPAA